MFLELARLRGGERTALQREAEPRRVGELGEILFVDGAEVALGRHVQPHRLDDVGAEMPRQPLGSERLVLVVDALFGAVLVQIVQQVAHVMQEGGRDQRGVGPVLFGEERGLQCVIGLRDRLAGGHFTAAPRKESGNFLKGGFRRSVGGHGGDSRSVAGKSSVVAGERPRSLRIKYVTAKMRVKPQATASVLKTPYHSNFLAIRATP